MAKTKKATIANHKTDRYRRIEMEDQRERAFTTLPSVQATKTMLSAFKRNEPVLGHNNHLILRLFVRALKHLARRRITK